MAKNYIDGFLLVVPTKRIRDYCKLSRKVGKVWRELGALEYRECVAEDMQSSCGIPFQKRAGAKKGESVVFAWIVYRSRSHRDRVNQKVMADPRISAMCLNTKMPFDMNRMSYGGFAVEVDA